jgi:hypothetical protein
MGGRQKQGSRWTCGWFLPRFQVGQDGGGEPYGQGLEVEVEAMVPRGAPRPFANVQPVGGSGVISNPHWADPVQKHSSEYLAFQTMTASPSSRSKE